MADPPPVKVVRKYELNASQVSSYSYRRSQRPAISHRELMCFIILLSLSLLSLPPRSPLLGRRETLEPKIQEKAARDRGARFSLPSISTDYKKLPLTCFLCFLSDLISSKVSNFNAVQ